MPLLFAVTLFVSAFLLFMVQPMVGKMILPLLGGSPAAWNTCMVFFQGLLLVGYLYAHNLTLRLPTSRQVWLHVAIFTGTVVWLAIAAFLSPNDSPVAVFRSLAPQGQAYPMFGVLTLLAVAIGLPFLVISSSAPLLQKWFASTNHPSASDPYFLYAASNAGSLISLLGYPLLVEPTLRLATQAWVWAGGFVLLTGLVYLCGKAAANPLPPARKNEPGKAEGGRRKAEAASDHPSRLPDPPTPPSLARRVRWLALAFVPSSLMLGVTMHLTTDIASVPLLWVIPLALYLLTFIIAYARIGSWLRPILGNVSPVLTLLLVFVLVPKVGVDLPLSTFLTLAMHLTVYFFTALLMHSELAWDRPDPQFLTGYYLWISMGGVLGGIFNALVAPIAFPLAFEYPIAIAVGCLLVPRLYGNGSADRPREGYRQYLPTVLDAVLPLGMFGLAIGLSYAATDWNSFIYVAEQFGGWVTQLLEWVGVTFQVSRGLILTLAVYAVPCMLCFLFIDRPTRFGLCVAAILAAAYVRNHDWNAITERSYFGILKVNEAANISHELNFRTNSPARDATPDEEKAEENYKLFTYTVNNTETGEETHKASVAVIERYFQMMHGTTLHGRQAETTWTLPIRDDLPPLGAANPWSVLALTGARAAWDFRQEPLTYYHRSGPVGAMFHHLRAIDPKAPVGMVGLGTGSVSCYALPGQRLTFYEIDPTVLTLVEHPREMAAPDGRRFVGPFTYVADARRRGAEVDFVMGDARLKLEERPDAKYSLLLVDAFSSDSIPIHLLTREAIELYLNRLAEGGVIALHISNRYIRLEPVVAKLARDAGLVSRVWSDDIEADYPGKTASVWVVLARSAADLGILDAPQLQQAVALFPRTAALADAAKQFGFDTPLVRAIQQSAGAELARFAWLVDLHGPNKELSALIDAEDKYLSAMEDFARQVPDNAPLRGIISARLMMNRPSLLVTAFSMYDPTEEIASVLRAERERRPARQEILQPLEQWVRTNERWLAQVGPAATLQAGVEKDLGLWPIRLPDLIQRYGAASSLGEVLEAIDDPNLEAALRGTLTKYSLAATLRDLTELEGGRGTSRLAEMADRYGMSSSLKAAVTREREFINRLRELAKLLPEGVRLESVIELEYSRNPKAAPYAEFVVNAVPVGPTGEVPPRYYRTTASVGEIAVIRHGEMFKPLREVPGVPAWTDDYSDVLRVLSFKEVQKTRKFFGLPTPLLDE